jgi:sulfonate transport system permease protein
MPESTATLVDAGPAPASVVQPEQPIELTRPSIGFVPRKPRVPRWARRSVGPVCLLVAWWAVCYFHVFTETEVASPAETWSAARQLWDAGQLQSNLWISLRRVLEGLSLGLVIGTTLAIVSGFFHLGEDLLDPVIQAIRAVPLFGLLPLFIVWFGIGEAPKIYLIAIGCMFPVYLNTYGGIRGVDAKLIEAGKTFGLNRFGVIRNIILPGSLPGFLVGLRFALVASWLMVIVAEQINAQSGIGYLIMEAETVNRIDIMFVGLTIYAMLGIIADLLVRQLEKHLLAWRRGFTGS